MMKKRPTPRSVANRLRLVGISILFLCACIGLALIYFQVYRSETLLKHSQRNFLRYETTYSPRGAILDRSGRMLATNRPIARLVWRGTGSHSFSPEQKELLSSLERILTISLLNDEDLLRAEQRCESYTLIEDLSFERLSIIVEQFPATQNLAIATSSTRYYPYGTVACHIVGYFRDTPTQKAGTLGLEKLFEEQLSGHPGAREHMVNSNGKLLATRDIAAAQAGQPLQTTIDFDLQLIAESLFEEGIEGALIAMDPFNGDLLAVVSRPAFDPNMFIGPISKEAWERCKKERPFLNRILTTYPPASLFKLITMTAGLEEKIISEEGSRWTCTGEISYGERMYHCSKKTGHGSLNPCEALAHSCNIPCFEIGRRISIDTLARYARLFGLGQKTGSLFAEKEGLVPTTLWKRKVYRERWWQGETLQVAIGQSYTLVTPLQMARVIGSICTGSLVRPRILLNEKIEKTPLHILPSTRDFLMRSMHKMTSIGTGCSLRTLTNFELYAKTGTAQTAILEKEEHELDKKYKSHGWFISCGKYKQNRPIVLVVILEHVGTSRVATALAKRFFIAYGALLDRNLAPQQSLTDTHQETPQLRPAAPAKPSAPTPATPSNNPQPASLPEQITIIQPPAELAPAIKVQQA